MQNLPPQIIKTPEAKIEQVSQSLKAFNLATEIATSLVPKIPNNEESGESNQLAHDYRNERRETINFITGNPMVGVQWKGSDDNNYRVINNVRSCEPFSTRDIDGREYRFNDGCRVIWSDRGNRNRGGIGFNVNNTGDVVIIADLPNDLLTNVKLTEQAMKQILYNDLNRNTIGNLKEYLQNNPQDLIYLLKWARQQHYKEFGNRSEIKTLDQYVAMTIAEENISTEIPKPAYFDFGYSSSNVPN